MAQLNVIGKFGVAIAVFIASLLIIPNPIGGRLAIAALALIIGGISLFMMKASAKAQDPSLS